MRNLQVTFELLSYATFPSKRNVFAPAHWLRGPAMYRTRWLFPFRSSCLDRPRNALPPT